MCIIYYIINYGVTPTQPKGAYDLCVLYAWVYIDAFNTDDKMSC